jgi:hypothetical protein
LVGALCRPDHEDSIQTGKILKGQSAIENFFGPIHSPFRGNNGRQSAAFSSGRNAGFGTSIAGFIDYSSCYPIPSTVWIVIDAGIVVFAFVSPLFQSAP